jgi:plasmid stabilization system protein ParE
VSGGGSYEVVFHRIASKEYLRARRWYVKEGGDPLGERFCREVDTAVQQVAASPESYPVFRQHYRWVRLDHFPYLLYYHILDESRVIVLAVAHGARRPGYWLRRAKS